MSFGPPEPHRSELHPPPSFWSTCASNQAPTAFLGDVPPHPHRTTGLNANFDGTAGASTVCSALRRRNKLIASNPGKVFDGAVGGRLRSGSSASRRRRRRPSRGAMGCLPRSSQSALGNDGVSASAAAKDASDSHGRFSPPTAVSQPKARECWGGDSSSRWHTPSPLPPPPRPRSSAPSPGEPRGGGERASDESTTRVLRWEGCGSETDELDLAEEKEEQARAMSPGRKGGQARSSLIGGISPRSASFGSPRRGAVGVGRRGGGGGRGPEVPGFAFLEIQRELLKQLESLFVSIADDRRHALVALKREENEWKASAMERARSDVRAAAAAAADGATDAACSSGGGGGGGGGGLEERIRENIVEEGPGAAARRAVGLVRVGEGDDSGSDDDGVGGDQRPWSMGRGRGRGRREQWRLPKGVVEEMRTEFAAKTDQETAEVLEQENKALLEARAGIAAREGARTKRELRELSDRLTNDGRDALAALQMELEAGEEARLAEERGKLREALVGSLQRERERLVTERKLAMFDLRDERRRESSQLAASLWEQAERSTAARRAEAVRLLDQAAERARVQLDALLQAQGERTLEGVRQSGSAKRKAAIKRAREEGERRCLEEIRALAEGVSNKNDAWLRMALQDVKQALDDGGNAVGAGGAESGGGGGGEGGDGDTVVAPALQLRAVEASEDCSRLGRRLVELVMKEALVRLRESGFDVSLRDDERLESGVHTTTTTTTNNNNNNKNNNNNNNNNNSDGTGSLGLRGSRQDQPLSPRVSENCTVSEKRQCRDCERLARANVELSRLMQHTTAPAPATTSPRHRAPPTLEAQEEGQASQRRSRKAAAVVRAEAGRGNADGGGGGCSSSGGSKKTARVKTRAPVVRLTATAGRESWK